MKIPLFNLGRQYRPLEKTIQNKWTQILETTSFTYGQETQIFEKNFAKLCQTKYSLGVGSGTAALIVTLKASGVGPGDEVITTPMTFAATSDAIILVGAKPVFADVMVNTGNLDSNEVEKKIGKKTKAILLVHLYGVPCEMDQFIKLAKKYKLLLLEDASHAHGSLYRDKRVGSFGLAACFSLYPSKMLGAAGNAGVISSNSKQFIENAKMYAHHGISDKKYYHRVSGYNELIDNLQAAVLNIKFKSLKQRIKEKLVIAEGFNRVFNKYDHQGMVWSEYILPSLYLYSVQMKDRSKFQKHLESRGISTGVYYPLPVHLQKSMKFLGHKSGDFPVAEKFTLQTVSIPAYPELSSNEIKIIIKALESFFKKSGSIF